MAQSFFRLSDNAFNTYTCPAAVLKKWNVPDKPTEDEDGEDDEDFERVIEFPGVSHGDGYKLIPLAR